MKRIIFTLTLLTSISTHSQFKITGFFDTKIGINYAVSNNLQAELRVNDNLDTEFNTELSLLYKLVSKDDYNLNLGAGISTFPFHSNHFDFLESFYIPLQIEINPFIAARNFGLVLESAYHFSEIIDASGIRNSIGLRYNFN
jgi:hypothetical protein